MNDTIRDKLTVGFLGAIGTSASWGGAVIGWMNNIQPFIQFGSVCLGFVIGLLTIRQLLKKKD